jgi:Na+/melibiose symporter-like transporter
VLPSNSPEPAKPPRAAKRAFSPGRTLLYGAGNVGAGTVFAFANAALPLYLAGYGFPNYAIGLLAQDRPPLAGLSQIVVGALSDRTHTRLGRRRPYILVGVPLTVAALLVLALHPPAWVMVLVLLLMTTALAVAYGPYLTLLRDLVPRRQRGRVGAALTLGSMVGQLGLLYLASHVWERQEGLVFGAVAATLLVGFGLAFVGVGEPARAPARPWNRHASGRAYPSICAGSFATARQPSTCCRRSSSGWGRAAWCRS